VVVVENESDFLDVIQLTWVVTTRVLTASGSRLTSRVPVIPNGKALWVRELVVVRVV
jgi:hypothetical protein